MMCVSTSLPEQHMQNKCLTTSGAQVHHIFVAANNGDTGLAARMHRRTTALKRFFYVRRMVTPQWAGRVGGETLPVPMPGLPTRTVPLTQLGSWEAEIRTAA